MFTEGDVALLGGRCRWIGVRIAGRRLLRLDGHHLTGCINGGRRGAVRSGVGGWHCNARIADGNAVRLDVHGRGEGLARQTAVVQIDLTAVRRGRRLLGENGRRRLMSDI